MLYQWRYIFKWTLLGLGVVSLSTCFLGLLFYMQSITDGPATLDYLVRGKCYLNNVTFIQQFCPREDNGFANPYEDSWQDCEIIQLEMISQIGFNCTWKYPEWFTERVEAEIQVQRTWSIGEDIRCVMDKANEICYLEANEIQQIVLITVIPFIIGCISLGIFGYLNWYKKDWIFGI